ncbi:response regulator [Halobacillus halophilus]|uniref:response regulator n=1 Tax=Halobacillus halophilus TaxID=1570 RepID=UPI0021E5A547
MTLTNIFQKANHEVVGEAADGKKAVELHLELQPDLTTMDVTMPGMNGLEALIQIKTQSQHAKVVMCSAMGQQKLIVEPIEKGAKDFIAKPFDERMVLEAIERVLS